MHRHPPHPLSPYSEGQGHSFELLKKDQVGGEMWEHANMRWLTFIYPSIHLSPPPAQPPIKKNLCTGAILRRTRAILKGVAASLLLRRNE